MKVLDGCGGAKQTVLVCMHAPVQMCLPTSVPAWIVVSETSVTVYITNVVTIINSTRDTHNYDMVYAFNNHTNFELNLICTN